MIELPISSEIVSKAQFQADHLPLLANSVTNGEGAHAGFIGELLVESFTGGLQKNTYDYDLVINGKTVDVKTKRCNTPPKADYYASVSAHNIRQKTDYYVFVRVLQDFSKAWILGGMLKYEFLTRAKFYEKGQRDPSNPSFTFSSSNFSLRAAELYSLKDLGLVEQERTGQSPSEEDRRPDSCPF